MIIKSKDARRERDVTKGEGSVGELQDRPPPLTVELVASVSPFAAAWSGGTHLAENLVDKFCICDISLAGGMHKQ